MLRGSTFADIDHIDTEGLTSLFNMIQTCPKRSPVLLKREKPKQSDPELKRLKSDRRKQQRALDRLNSLYLYSEDSMSEREYIIQKQQITDSLQEIDEAIGMITQEQPWMQTMDDTDFMEQASTFILNDQISKKQYIYFQDFVEPLDPKVVKRFFVSIIEKITLKEGRVQTIVFRNGITHTFTWKDEESKNTQEP